MDDGRPRWRSVAEAIAADVRSGTYPPGSQIPPAARLAEDHRVAVGTVRKAIDALKSAGTLRGDQGSGVYVAGPAPDRIEAPDERRDILRRLAALEEWRRSVEQGE